MSADTIECAIFLVTSSLRKTKSQSSKEIHVGNWSAPLSSAGTIKS